MFSKLVPDLRLRDVSAGKIGNMYNHVQYKCYVYEMLPFSQSDTAWLPQTVMAHGKFIVPDKRSRFLEVALVRRLLSWVLGIWSGEGIGKG